MVENMVILLRDQYVLAGTNFVTSLNLRSFMDVYQKRVLTPWAQWEIKAMMEQMAELLIEEEPWLSHFISKE